MTSDGPLPGADDTTTWRWSADRDNVGTISPDPDGSSGILKRRTVKKKYNDDGYELDMSYLTYYSLSAITLALIFGREFVINMIPYFERGYVADRLLDAGIIAMLLPLVVIGWLVGNIPDQYFGVSMTMAGTFAVAGLIMLTVGAIREFRQWRNL